MSKNQKKFIFNVKSLDKFRSSLLDLSKISPVIKIKFKGDNMLMYALEASGTIVLAFKSFDYSINDFFQILDDDMRKDDSYSGEFDDGMSNKEEEIFELDWIIGDAKIFYSKLSFFDNKEIKGKFNIVERNGVKQINEILLNDGRYKFSYHSSEAHVIRDISIDQLNELLDIETSDIKMVFPTNEFNETKRAATIDSDDSVCIRLYKNKVIVKQSNWSIVVGDIENHAHRKDFCFNKKFLKYINPKESEINIWAFSTFILYQEDNERFMISYEQEY